MTELTCCISQLLDLLLDVNNSAQIPAEKRIDMTVDVPALSAIPPLVSNEDLSKCAELDTPAGKAIYREIRGMLEEKAAAAASSRNGARLTKPLSLLMATVPHHSVNSPLVSADLLSTLETHDGHAGPITYLTADQLDDYLDDADASLGAAPPAPAPQHPAPHDVALRNPNSVYNWLRKNEPKVFLQDNEGSEKSQGKPGSLRGAGKRASLPAPAKPDALEFVEEDGLGYDASLAGPVSAKGKRKREDGDDSTYHPSKGQKLDENGKPRVKRAYNRKKKPEGSEANTPTPAKKGKKEKAKQNSLAPAQHPFGGPM